MLPPKSSFRLLCLVVGLIGMYSCQKNSIPELEIPANFQGEISIPAYYIFGPFLNSDQNPNDTLSIDNDELLQFNTSETELTEAKLAALHASKFDGLNTTTSQFISEKFTLPDDKLDFFAFFPSKDAIRKESSVYLASVLNSETEQDLVYMASTCYGLKVWLNGIQIVSNYGILDTLLGMISM